MKRILSSMLMLLILCAGALAQTVTVADVEAVPGETVAFSLSLQDGKADTYTSLQFNIKFPNTGFTTTGDYTISSAWRNASSVIGDVDAQGIAIVPVSSSEAISGTDVDNLLTVSFTVDSGVALGDYDVTLSKITFGYGFTGKDITEDVTFTVHVVSMHTLVLDENSTTVPDAAEGVNVQVKRTIKAGEWSSICLPFAMTEAQVKGAFGEDVQLGNFCDTESTFDGDDVTAISICFEPATAIEANHPYIIKVSAPVTEFEVENVDVDPAEDDALVEVDNGKSGSRRVVYGGFYGTYHAGTTLEEYALFLNSNKFWYSKGLTQMKAFRAYFIMLDVLTAVEEAGSRISLSLKDETTGITTTDYTDGTNHAETWFTIDGRRVVKPQKKGLYISKERKLWLNR